jgi:hypothetical protein
MLRDAYMAHLVVFEVCTLALLAVSSVAGPSGSDSTWLSEIRSLEATCGGHLGMMVTNLRTGETISYNLFDALYANEDFFRNWFVKGTGRLLGAYTDHLSEEYETFEASVRAQAGDRLSFTRTAVPHDLVPRTFIALWVSRLAPEWKLDHEHE